jgi:hypothetical protein
LENGQYATLLECVEGGKSYSSGREFNAYRESIIPNMVLLGPVAWGRENKVRSIRFTFAGAEAALYYGGHTESKFELRDGEGRPLAAPMDVLVTNYGRLEILKVKTVDGVTLTLRMDIVSTRDILDPRFTSTPTVIIGFDDCLSLREAYRVARDVLTFFEISLGHRSRMKSITVRTVSEDEFIKAIETDKHQSAPEFHLRLWHDGWTMPTAKTHPGDVLFPVYNHENRKITEAALAVWIERRAEWSTAYWLAHRYMADANAYDRDRLLRLMAWFEAIPSFRGGSGVSDDSLSKLRKAVRGLPEFVATGITSERLTEVMAELKRLPLKYRLAQAVEQVRAAFGRSIVPSSTGADCHRAASLRNLAAHGEEAIVHENFDALVRGVHALELICCLSMMSDLDLAKDRLEHQGHPSLQYAREMAVSAARAH